MYTYTPRRTCIINGALIGVAFASTIAAVTLAYVLGTTITKSVKQIDDHVLSHVFRYCILPFSSFLHTILPIHVIPTRPSHHPFCRFCSSLHSFRNFLPSISSYSHLHMLSFSILFFIFSFRSRHPFLHSNLRCASFPSDPRPPPLFFSLPLWHVLEPETDRGQTTLMSGETLSRRSHLHIACNCICMYVSW